MFLITDQTYLLNILRQVGFLHAQQVFRLLAARDNKKRPNQDVKEGCINPCDYLMYIIPNTPNRATRNDAYSLDVLMPQNLKL